MQDKNTDDRRKTYLESVDQQIRIMTSPIYHVRLEYCDDVVSQRSLKRESTAVLERPLKF